jgi:hypothetical protein
MAMQQYSSALPRHFINVSGKTHAIYGLDAHGHISDKLIEKYIAEQKGMQ